METIEKFVDNVLHEETRGSAESFLIDDNVYVEVSVGAFEYGRINVRIIVEEPEAAPEYIKYYRQLFRFDKQYEEIHSKIVDFFENKSKSELTSDYVWEIQHSKDPREYPFLPETFNPDNTLIFTNKVRLKESTTSETLEANRKQDY